jgi:hypothetical protein
MLISASSFWQGMQTELDTFKAVIGTYGVNRAAVKYALRMRRKCMRNSDLDGATEWHVFALAILKRLRSDKYKSYTIH